jgi:hypothetical protein
MRTGNETKQEGMFRLLRNKCFCVYYGKYKLSFNVNIIINICIFNLFIHQWLYSPLLGLGLFFRLVIYFTHKVGLYGQVISPSQGRYLHTGQHKHRINAHANIHALNRIGTHDPSVRASGDSACFTPRGHGDRHSAYNSVVLVRKRTIPTEGPQPAGEVSANFS